jgi:hypothetical protein
MHPFVTTAPFQYGQAIRVPALDARYFLSSTKTPVFIDLISSPLASRLHALLWRLGRISLAGNTAVSIFRIEVSGWNKRQSFFVEKSELHWGAQSGKQNSLSSAIPDGAVGAACTRSNSNLRYPLSTLCFPTAALRFPFPLSAPP